MNFNEFVECANRHQHADARNSFPEDECADWHQYVMLHELWVVSAPACDADMCCRLACIR